MPFSKKTPEVCREIGVSYHQMCGAIRSGRLAPPTKDSSGDYQWSQADVDRARRVFAGRRQPQEAAHAG